MTKTLLAVAELQAVSSPAQANDNFSFSATAVPEAGTVTLSLWGLAAIGLVSRRRS